ncbi:TMEM165/GDT1 family protein [Sphingomonas baiyangensis]|nr:TMEM165/GDT1 family protein [Sphingomonas baiyangensis]
MESLLSGFVAALVAHATDRPPWLAAILADRYRRPLAILAGVLVAQLLVNAIAAIAAIQIRPLMTPNARSLMLGLALLFAAIGAAWRMQPPSDRLEGWRLGAFGTSAIGLFILAFGDRTQFIAFGTGIWGSSPLLAAVGASIGATLASVPAVLLGEHRWRRLPLDIWRWSAAVILAALGSAACLSALRII